MENKDLEKLFLKDSYSYFKNKKFNVMVLMGGYLYLYYRQVYILGTIIMAIDILLFYLNLYWVIIVINLGLGVIFNKLYLIIVQKKIIDYRLNYMDKEEVIKECKKNKTSIGITIVMVIISLILVIILMIDFDSYKVGIGDLSLILNKSWDKKDYNNEYYASYSYEDYDNSCSLTLERILFGDEDVFIDSFITSYNGDIQRDEVVINGFNYKQVIIKNDGLYNYVYVANYKDYLYAILFDVYSDNGICNEYKEDILGSIKVKN